jgi:hypothetical protein
MVLTANIAQAIMRTGVVGTVLFIAMALLGSVLLRADEVIR